MLTHFKDLKGFLEQLVTLKKRVINDNLNSTYRYWKQDGRSNFEEFKGTGNSELILDRKVADKRIYPALDITRSGTRREELLFEKDDLSKMNVLRRIISPMGTMDGIEFLIAKLKNTKNNADFFESMNKSAN